LAGTDRKKAAKVMAAPGPVVILARPQLGMNIGTAARAMLNCGLTELRLVSPRDGWPNSAAYTAASRADAVLDKARVFDDVAAAIADLDRVYAATARPRDMAKPVMTPRRAAAAMRAEVAAGGRVGLLFGPERTGLETAETAQANVIVTVPLNPGFSSLNLAQAVLLVGYEWFVAGEAALPERMPARSPPATKGDLQGLIDHLTAELDASGYFHNIEEKRASMLVNIRNIFERTPLTQQDVRTLRGIVKALALGRPRRERKAPANRPPLAGRSRQRH
jgi:tRNA/rRNA methyltransferase